jgi:AbiU2
MAISVRDSKEFQRLLEAISWELVEANIFFRMHMDLIKAASRFQREINEARTFWDRTITAHLDAAILRLCRIFDQNDRNLGLGALLDTILANPHFFAPKEFARRVEGRPAAEALTAEPPILDRAQLDRDIASVSRSGNTCVDLLIDVRHNYYSHRNAEDVAVGRIVADEHPLSRDDVGELLRCGMEIANRYSSLFHANLYSTQMVGHDDFIHVLGAVRFKLEASEREFAEECRRLGIDPPAA